MASDKILVTCPLCNGSGRVMRLVCRLCGGTGKITVDAPH